MKDWKDKLKKEFENKFPVSIFQRGLNYPQARALKETIYGYIESLLKKAEQKGWQKGFNDATKTYNKTISELEGDSE